VKLIDNFITKATQKHGDKFDYSQVEYVNCKSKVKIICPEHGEFYKTPESHINSKNGCPGCRKQDSSERLRITIQELLPRFKNKHGERYSYDIGEYQNMHSKINIKCEKHGWFTQSIIVHLTSSGCRDCMYDNLNNDLRLSTKEFIKKSKQKFKDLDFDYKKTHYTNYYTNLVITCKKHGDFTVTPSQHLTYGKHCRDCINFQRMTTEEFINKCTKVHGGLYDYSMVVYKNSTSPVKIKCPEGHIFEQKAGSHINGHGCMTCARRLTSSARFVHAYSDKIKLAIYLIEINEEFLKIGITKSLEMRIKKIENVYGKGSVIVLKTLEGDVKTILELEDSIIYNANLIKYHPKENFGGYTECFALSEKASIMDLIKTSS